LEARLAPSTVTNLLDAGPGSLRQAIADTPAGGTVDFQPGLRGTIALTGGQLAIAKDLTITGPGAGVITVSGNGTSPAFNVAATFTVTISGLTVANDLGSDGISSDGLLAVTDCAISASYAGIANGTGSAQVTDCAVGTGGITNGSGSMQVTGCTVSGGDVCGIYNGMGSLTVTDSAVSDNGTVHSFTGGIENSGGTLTVTGSAISGNHGGIGGGIYNGGTATVTDSVVSDNTANEGGGIINRGTLTVTNSSVTGNAVSGGGGGIANERTLTITGSTINDNTAGGGGGIDNLASLVATSSTISGNTAGAFEGGGIYNIGGASAAFTDCAISGNTAGTDGGGIWNVGPAGRATLALTNSTMSGNSAGSGAAVQNDASAPPVTITASTIRGAYVQTGGSTLVSGRLTVDLLDLRGGTLSGTGVINGDVRNAAEVSPGTATATGVIVINGDYTQTGAGSLSLRLGGLAAGDDYDRLVVTGLARLDGTLAVTLVNGYQPQTGDQLQPLLFAGGQGLFSRYSGDAGRFSFLYVYDDGSFLPVGLTLVAL
jgi:hypothetical protein